MGLQVSSFVLDGTVALFATQPLHSYEVTGLHPERASHICTDPARIIR